MLKNKRIINHKILLMSIILIMLSLTINVQSQFLDCHMLVQQWIQDPQHLPPVVFANSGKFLNDLGDYNNCVHHLDDYIYITMSVFNKAAMNYQFMGLCAPIQCKNFLVSNQQTQFIQTTLNGMIKNSTKSQFDIFTDMNLFAPQDEKPEMDWSNYLTIILLAFLVFLGILGSLVAKVAPQTKIMPLKIVKCFSFYDNLQKIIDVPKTVQNQNLLFLNGCRILSIMWIIFGHDMWFRLLNIKNWVHTQTIITSPGIVTIFLSTYYAVDVFFWIGGFLITISLLQQFKKKVKFFMFYLQIIIHRIIRIWPTYVVAILIFWKVAPYFGSGPIWHMYQNFSCQCDNGGVTLNLFFMDNFGDHGPNGRHYCFGWGWYLAVDFQLFLITPFILYTYAKNKKLGWILTFVLFLGTVITAFVMIYVNEWHYPIPSSSKLKPQPTFMDDFYYKPYIRASAYFMGLFTGYIYFQWKNNNQAYVKVINKIKNSIPLRIAFYIVGIACTQFIIWITVPLQQGQEWSQLTQAFYNSLNRVVFLIGIILLTFAAMFGCKNDPVKFILGHSFFSPLAKISFCMYLTHFIVIMNGVFSSRMNLYYQTMSALYVIVTDIVFSILLALFLTLIVQSPTLGLQKILLKGGDKKKKNQQISAKQIQALQKSYNLDEGKSIKQKLISDYSELVQAKTANNTTEQNQNKNNQSLL